MKKKNRFLANKTFVVFSILAVCIILTAVFAPVVTRGVDPLKGSLVDALLPPCKEHIFGTDKMGRDIFSRVIYGARASLSATLDRKSTRLNSSHANESRMPSSA